MHGIVVETDCGNRAGYPILTVNLYNARGTVAAILFPLLCDEYIAVLWHRLPQISRRTFTAFVYICAFSCRHVSSILAFPFFVKCQRHVITPPLQSLLHMCWEWIAATVQAIRLHLETELKRGGTVAAISLSTICLQCIACLSAELIALQFDLIPVRRLPHHTPNFGTPPLPTPNAFPKALVFQRHIAAQSANEHGGSGCMG